MTSANSGPSQNAPSLPLSPVPSDPKPEHCLDSSSDLSSDSDIALSTTYMNNKHTYSNMASSKMTSQATVEYSVMKHCPILTPGDISAKILVDLGDVHNKYFIVKDIANADKVKKVLGGFKDIHIYDWIVCECKHLIALLYKNFMAEVKDNYLPVDWEEQTCS